MSKFKFPALGIVGIVVFAILLLILIPSSFVVVGAGEVGVVSLFGKVEDNELQSGLTLKNPFATVTKMATRTQEYTMSSSFSEGSITGDDSVETRAKDGAVMNIDITVLYHLEPSRASDIYKNLGVSYQETIIRPAIRSVVRDVVAGYSVDEVYASKRGDVELTIKKNLDEALKERGFVLEDTLIRKINLSKVLSDSIEQKLAAQQEAAKYDFILEKEKKEADRKRIEAAGQRDSQKLISEGLTNQYLYYLYIQNLKENTGTIYVPTNPDSGLPLFKDIK